jgi:hypothetical protein
MTEIDKSLCHVLYVLVIGLLILAVVIAIGKVQQETSFGLKEVFGILAILANGIIATLAGRRNPDNPVNPASPVKISEDNKDVV